LIKARNLGFKERFGDEVDVLLEKLED